MQQNLTNFLTVPEVFDCGGLSGRVEPAAQARRIHLPEAQSRRVLPAETPTFAPSAIVKFFRRPVRFSSIRVCRYPNGLQRST